MAECKRFSLSLTLKMFYIRTRKCIETLTCGFKQGEKEKTKREGSDGKERKKTNNQEKKEKKTNNQEKQMKKQAERNVKNIYRVNL